MAITLDADSTRYAPLPTLILQCKFLGRGTPLCLRAGCSHTLFSDEVLPKLPFYSETAVRDPLCTWVERNSSRPQCNNRGRGIRSAAPLSLPAALPPRGWSCEAPSAPCAALTVVADELEDWTNKLFPGDHVFVHSTYVYRSRPVGSFLRPTVNWHLSGGLAGKT